jgi:hypothetical protein
MTGCCAVHIRTDGGTPIDGRRHLERQRAAWLHSQPPIGGHQPRADLAARLHVVQQNVGAAGAPFRDLVLRQVDDLHALLARDRKNLTFVFGDPLPDLELKPLDGLLDRGAVRRRQRLPVPLRHDQQIFERSGRRTSKISIATPLRVSASTSCLNSATLRPNRSSVIGTCRAAFSFTCRASATIGEPQEASDRAEQQSRCGPTVAST